MDVDTTTRNWIIGGVIVIILLFVGWWLFTKPQASDVLGTNSTSTVTGTDTGTGTITGEEIGSTSSTGTGTSTGDIVTTLMQNESVRADDQAAGGSVSLAALTLSRTSWVAVRDQKSILGAARFPASATSGIVPLIRPTAAGVQYMVLIYVDDGDGAFDFHKDMLVTNESGAPIGDTFLAQ
jgi:hypothetical protein